MNWEIELSPDAAKWLRKADPQTAQRIRAALRAITTFDSPRNRGKALTGNLSGLGDIASVITDLSAIFKTHAWSFW